MSCVSCLNTMYAICIMFMSNENYLYLIYVFSSFGAF